MNKKYTLALLTAGIFSVQILIGQTNQRLAGISKDYTLNDKNEIDFIRLDNSVSVYEINSEAFLNNTVLINNVKVKKSKSNTDELGFTHTRYQLSYNSFPIHNTQIIVHAQNGKLVSLNGNLSSIEKPVNSVLLTESKALQLALQKVNAKKYKWEDKTTQSQLKKSFNNPNFSYYPKAEVIIYQKDNKFYYAYKLAIYADEPLYGANVIVDAQNGAILAEENLIHTIDVPGTGITKFSGTQNIICDSISPTSFRLRETSRGLGIETYDLNTSTATSAAVDYTNTSSAWTNTTTIDQIGTDAHWGAEMTYDYYWNIHSRNSINNAGFKLISYADYGVSYGNAFWNGAYMTYGSGSAGGFVGLDICGHEITHGLTGMTAGLVYSNESGALNESYSDIFGLCIEAYAKPLTWNWIIGETVGGIRSFSNPNSMSQPDTYYGSSWYTGTGDNGGVHTNSGVSNYWFYLLTVGGTGVNDISNSYTVSGLGMADAAKIAFRALTVYFASGTNYASARNLTTQAAIDLFGPCSNEVYQTKNAWYAVGVGPNASGTLTPVANFTSIGTLQCSLPYSANFYNTSIGADTYLWDFGDGSAVSTATNPIHTYTANGTYSVKLKTTSSCAVNPDSIIKTSYIVINSPSVPTATDDIRCGAGSLNLNASGTGQQFWYSSPTVTGTPLFVGNTFTTPSLTTTTTYYVVNTFTNPVLFGGPTSGTIGTGAYYPLTTAYDSLTVLQPCKLKTVMVQASTTNTRTIQLRNNLNAVLQSTTVVIPSGISTVTVNFNLTPGYGYRLGLASGAAQLYRNSTGVSYPYNIGGLVNITGSSQGPNYHFYFYNWEIEPGDCKSSAVPVTASVLPGSAISVNSSTICSGQNTSLIASGAATYTWNTGATTSSITVSPSVTTIYTVSTITSSCGTIVETSTVTVNTTPVVTMSTSVNNSCASDSLVVLSGLPTGGVFTGTGVSGNNFNPAVGVGTYTISYNYWDANGCGGVLTKTITVSACVGINELNHSSYFKVYPNPANDFIILTSEKEADIILKVFDATGKMLIAKQLNGKSNRIDINTLAKGIYFIEAQDGDKNTYRQKIIKQ